MCEREQAISEWRAKNKSCGKRQRYFYEPWRFLFEKTKGTRNMFLRLWKLCRRQGIWLFWAAIVLTSRKRGNRVMCAWILRQEERPTTRKVCLVLLTGQMSICAYARWFRLSEHRHYLGARLWQTWDWSNKAEGFSSTIISSRLLRKVMLPCPTLILRTNPDRHINSLPKVWNYTKKYWVSKWIYVMSE